MVFVKLLSGRTAFVEAENVCDVRQKIEEIEGVPADEQRLVCGGRQLVDEDLVEKDSTIFLSLSLLGGAKKRKKKVYTTPKKIKHKRKKVKLATLKYYKIEKGKIVRLREECKQSTCGGGIFMAQHSNRHYCGRCHNTLISENPVATSSGKGAAKGKGKK